MADASVAGRNSYCPEAHCNEEKATFTHLLVANPAAFADAYRPLHVATGFSGIRRSAVAKLGRHLRSALRIRSASEANAWRQELAGLARDVLAYGPEVWIMKRSGLNGTRCCRSERA